jgi:hypothetical protein
MSSFIRDHVLRECLEGQLACALQLVRLRVNVEEKLTLSPGPCDKPIERLRAAGLERKTVRELAVLSGKQDLINAIKELKESDVKIANCRCGSRLSWKNCHAGGNLHQSHYPIPTAG